MISPTISQIFFAIFLISLILIVYTYILFPIWTTLRGLFFAKPVKYDLFEPFISLIIAAHNEEDVIAEKLRNALELVYPHEKLEIIVASNGSTDRTCDIVRSFESQGPVKLLDIPQKGKNPALNIALKEVKGEVLVFTDADSMLHPKSLIYLMSPLADPAVGGVGGDYRYENKKGSKEGTGEKTYWGFDRFMKHMQSQAGSMTSATGQIYAVRKAFIKTIPSGVTDDFFTSTQVISNHKRLVFEPQAYATGPVADNKGEYRRKLRVTTRGLNSVKAQAHLLNPFKYGLYAIQLFTHKVLRRLVVFPLILLFITAPMLWSYGLIFQLIAIGCVGFLLVGLVSHLLQNYPIGKSKIFSLVTFFFTVNRAAFMATFKVLRGERIDVWATERAG